MQAFKRLLLLGHIPAYLISGTYLRQVKETFALEWSFRREWRIPFPSIVRRDLGGQRMSSAESVRAKVNTSDEHSTPAKKDSSKKPQ